MACGRSSRERIHQREQHSLSSSHRVCCTAHCCDGKELSLLKVHLGLTRGKQSFTHALYYLAADPSLVGPMRAEVDAVLKEENGDLGSRTAVSKLKYIDSFLRESQRLNGTNASEYHALFSRTRERLLTRFQLLFGEGLCSPSRSPPESRCLQVSSFQHQQRPLIWTRSTIRIPLFSTHGGLSVSIVLEASSARPPISSPSAKDDTLGEWICRVCLMPANLFAALDVTLPHTK